MSAVTEGEAALLQLLASGASAAEIAAAPSPPELRRLALEVHAASDVLRRREHELEALVETARELASLRDPGGVIDAIVRRTRALLGTDVAYLTLYDPDQGDTFMRATAGSVSAAFQSVRLPLGAGLGGLVASTRMPYSTPDYFADSRFRHTTTIDGAVGEEGLVAICGVPLIVGDDFVGVLFAADRGPRSFSHDEVGLLGSLAALAAVSIVQVRTLKEAHSALTALSAAHETVRRQAESVERAAAAHDRFAELVLQGGGVDDVTQALADLLGGWVVLLDDHGRREAVRGDAPEGTRGEVDPLFDSDVVRTAQRTGRLTQLGNVHAVPVAAGRQMLGTLLLGGVAALDEGDQRTVERAAVVTSLVVLFGREAAAARQQALSDLLADLVLQRGDEAERAHILRSQGLRPDEPFCLLVLRPTGTQQRRSLVLAAGTALGEGSLVAEYDGDVVALVPAANPAVLAQTTADRLRPTSPATVAGSGPVKGVAGIGTAHAEASRTLAALVALGHVGSGAASADLGFAGLIVGDDADVTAYVRRVLGAVLDYDRGRGTDLLPTLEAYFAAGSSPRRAATSLHVHTNTVTQRLERVRHLLGPSWQEPGPSLEIQLALRLRRLIRES